MKKALKVEPTTRSIPSPIYDETDVPNPEYRVRMVARYVVTRYCFPYVSKDGLSANSGSSEVIAEFNNETRAYEVATALAKSEFGGPSTVSV